MRIIQHYFNKFAFCPGHLRIRVCACSYSPLHSGPGTTLPHALARWMEFGFRPAKDCIGPSTIVTTMRYALLASSKTRACLQALKILEFFSGCRGGVVTHQPAKLSTPVRFRAAPPPATDPLPSALVKNMHYNENRRDNENR